VTITNLDLEEKIENHGITANNDSTFSG
jgi:hypothetical protein